MDSINSRSKKRKSDSSRDAERSLYSNFVTAANAVSALYAQAAQTQQDEREAGARDALERVIHFAFREYGSAGAVPLAALVDFANGEVKAMKSPQLLKFPAPYIPHPQPPTSDLECEEDVAMQGTEALRGCLMNNNNFNNNGSGGGHGRRPS